jgi:hypothetical protein
MLYQGAQRILLLLSRRDWAPMSERASGIKAALKGAKKTTLQTLRIEGLSVAEVGNALAEHLKSNERPDAVLDEIPNYEGDLRAPNCFVPRSEAQVARKLEIVLGAFASQRARHWFNAETIRALLRLRGVECGAVHTEAFHARKLMLVPAAEERWRA